MSKVILVEIDVRNYLRSCKRENAQKMINEYIADKNLDVISASLFIENEDKYIFTLTLR